ncbi:hypothetical protein II906_00315 [bacterium]|nr:hypothetical protein [bacterium]
MGKKLFIDNELRTLQNRLRDEKESENIAMINSVGSKQTPRLKNLGEGGIKTREKIMAEKTREKIMAEKTKEKIIAETTINKPPVIKILGEAGIKTAARESGTQLPNLLPGITTEPSDTSDEKKGIFKKIIELLFGGASSIAGLIKGNNNNDRIL